jgi:phage tail-like protein
MALLGPLANATGLRLDPPLNHNFLIMMAETSSPGSFIKSAAFSLLGDVLFGGFSECSGLQMVQADEKRWEGGLNNTEHRFPTRITWPNITLKQGVSRISQSGWDWLYDFGEGKVKRMDGLIILMDDRHIPHNLWTFKRAFPVKYDGPPMKGAGNEVAIQSLELAHEGLWQLSILKLGEQALGAVGVSL